MAPKLLCIQPGFENYYAALLACDFRFFTDYSHLQLTKIANRLFYCERFSIAYQLACEFYRPLDGFEWGGAPASRC